MELGDGAIAAGTSSYDVNMEMSTPDHMTSSSDPDVVQVCDFCFCWLTDNVR